MIYKIGANELIARGFLTKPVIGLHETHYDTSRLEFNKKGEIKKESFSQFDDSCLTKGIINEIKTIAETQNRKGVMVFASSIKHAERCLSYFEQGEAWLITGATKKKERELIIEQFKRQEFKYLVNVAVLTTGFDAPHVDVVAVLRPTDSASLFQQIIGRGLRLSKGKKDCLILDYAENIENFDLYNDLFEPSIKTRAKSESTELMEVVCPSCSGHNYFKGRENKDNYPVSPHGYFQSLAGVDLIDMETNKPFPAHYGRRCTMLTNVILGERCTYRWSCKECPECSHENDIAARVCEKCKAELVDPNDKLSITASSVLTEWPKVLECKAWHGKKYTNKKGNDCLRVTFITNAQPIQVFYVLSGNEWAVKKSRQTLEQLGIDFNDPVTSFAHCWPPSHIRVIKTNQYFEVYKCDKPETNAQANTPSKSASFNIFGRPIQSC